MNNVEAKFILQGYRPNGADAGDPAFADALEQVAHDPALRAWFAREQAVDAELSVKLAQVQPPVELREAILAGGRVSAPPTASKAWWRNQAFVALAASAAVVAGLTLALWPKDAVANEALTEFVAADAARAGSHGGGADESTVAFRALLSQPDTKLGGALPVEFAALRRGDCRTMSCLGRDVVEVCFKRNGVWFHCYVAKRTDFSGITSDSLQFIDREGISLATWADASNVYVVVSKTGRAALQALL